VRLWLLVAAVVLGALAASWHFLVRGETTEAEPVSSLVDFPAGDGEPAPERGFSGRVLTTSGLQTTVPDTVGFDEKTAAFTLEEGGFRVRVMDRKVSDSSDEGIVVQQLPRGGSTRRLNWIVTIVVGRLR
jgi:hypothetical protein